MRTKTMLTILTILSIIMGSCISHNISGDKISQSKFNISFQAGSNKGGMVENSNMEDIPGIAVDAFSGATRKGFNVGARVSYPVGIFRLETGLDFMQNSQVFTYNDDISYYFGQRDFSTNQLMIPTTLVFKIITRNHREGLFQLKLGHLMQYNSIRLKDEHGSLPSWSANKWSNGALLGLTFTPFTLGNGSRIGFFIEGYRGTQIYHDHYNQSRFEMPGSAFIKYGIIYNLK
jgi:hypothetical protein